ncbi:MAG: bifunctional 4-hydroxy-2-oxoglutarate aldolase/2-dehydro-3-deoxy-phosphogluconate aldolase [Synergistaceae bacterium]|jgi:2-dehydro-3-deoxyphosphogluconate aldolase/(4S)-4-hydroxy-2-oxoglutarate aldolase|nr:bifunctional 4-hydroxy-2-oxoglutarate aldolase/2-dehydro-3-deoxy-phosphogluconate aldolase [Synergistaceae bacterium]
MNETLEKLGEIGIIPVIRLNSPEQAKPLGRALIAGFLSVAEITFRTSAARESIRIISKEFPGITVGAGTVLSTDQADEAIEAGASYIVTPGFNPKVVERCVQKNVPIIPGVSNPSQIEEALEMGLEVLKFFPAESSGGAGTLKAFAGPYGDKVSFIPTGGVNERNLAGYLSLSNVHAVGGSWMVPDSLIEAGDYSGVERLCREARYLSLGFSLLHIGINAGEDGDAGPNAELFSSMLGLPVKDGSSSAFVGKPFEIMKANGRGKHGHIAIETLSVERALGWFSDFGFKPVSETIRMKDGHISFAYVEPLFMGFALHLNRRG